MSRVGLLALAAACLAPPILAVAAAPTLVDQVRRSFSVREVHVARGGIVRFNNADEFLHQIYIDNPQLKFSSNEQAPGDVVDIAFPVAGSFDVRCEIHPKMLMKVIVD